MQIRDLGTLTVGTFNARREVAFVIRKHRLDEQSLKTFKAHDEISHSIVIIITSTTAMILRRQEGIPLVHGVAK